MNMSIKPSTRLVIIFMLFSFPLLAQITPPPPLIDPPVPIDGGIAALVIAGGAMGYKKYKMRKQSEEI